MKKVFITMLLIALTAPLISQTVKGEILSDTNNVTVVRVWGTSEERGFAYGYLVGDRMIDVLEGFSIPYWGAWGNWINVKSVITGGVSFSIDPVYWNEARAMMDGATAAGHNPSGYDSVDVMAANLINDIYGWAFTKGKSGFHCSTFMNWNDATSGTNLDGCSVISRHMETYNRSII